MDDEEELEARLRSEQSKPPLEAVLRLHEAVAEASYHVDDTDYLFVTDVGLLRVWYRAGSFDGDDPLPSADSELTAWRDVRDVEMSGRLVQLSTNDMYNPYGHSTEVRLRVQLPRVDLTASGQERCRTLMLFGKAMLRYYNRSRS
jgi:hypothetical protein